MPFYDWAIFVSTIGSAIYLIEKVFRKEKKNTCKSIENWLIFAKSDVWFDALFALLLRPSVLAEVKRDMNGMNISYFVLFAVFLIR